MYVNVLFSSLPLFPSLFLPGQRYTLWNKCVVSIMCLVFCIPVFICSIFQRTFVEISKKIVQLILKNLIRGQGIWMKKFTSTIRKKEKTQYKLPKTGVKSKVGKISMNVFDPDNKSSKTYRSVLVVDNSLTLV